MTSTSKIATMRRDHQEDIRYVCHDSFADRAAWCGEWLDAIDEQEFAHHHMPDETTRECARRMHYAAYRADTATRPTDAERWRWRYYVMRDRIVLGNRKLIFAAVQRRLFRNASADDLIGDCYLVMIRSVAAYNPWLGIRFSTYAYTCLMRALNRLVHRSLADRLAQHLSLDQAPVQQVAEDDSQSHDGDQRVDEFLSEDHPLLSTREKAVIRRRFQFAGPDGAATLEKVGRELGISKERVRQVQASALDKLRKAMNGVEAR